MSAGDWKEMYQAALKQKNRGYPNHGFFCFADSLLTQCTS